MTREELLIVRLQELMDLKGLNQSQLAEKSGVSQQTISRALKVGRLRSEALQQLAEYLGVTIDYFYVTHKSVNTTNKSVGDSATQYSVVRTTDNEGRDNIVLVDRPAFAGYVANRLETSMYDDFPTMRFPGIVFKNGDFRAFRVVGSSMATRLGDGDIVIGQYVENWKELTSDRVYVVVTHEDIVVKKVLNRIRERGVLRMKSYNLEYQDYELDKDSIQEVWEVKGFLGFNLSNPIESLENRLTRLEDTVYRLSIKSGL